MPLRIDSLTPTERQYLYDNLDDPNAAERLLSQMLNDRALVEQMQREVRILETNRRVAQTQQEAAKNSRYFQFAIEDEANPRCRKQLKVHDYDLSAFCSHFGLSESKMLRVAAGEIDDHRGWVQGINPGNLGHRRATYLREHNPYPAGISGYPGVRGPDSVKPMLPEKWWKPAE